MLYLQGRNHWEFATYYEIWVFFYNLVLFCSFSYFHLCEFKSSFQLEGSVEPETSWSGKFFFFPLLSFWKYTLGSCLWREGRSSFSQKSVYSNSKDLRNEFEHFNSDPFQGTSLIHDTFYFYVFCCIFFIFNFIRKKANNEIVVKCNFVC